MGKKHKNIKHGKADGAIVKEAEEYYHYRQKRTFPDNKRVNTWEKYNNYKCICTYITVSKHEAKIDKSKMRF